MSPLSRAAACLAASALVAFGCDSSLALDLDGWPCDPAGRCLPGYTCDAPTSLCVSSRDEGRGPSPAPHDGGSPSTARDGSAPAPTGVPPGLVDPGTVPPIPTGTGTTKVPEAPDSGSVAPAPTTAPTTAPTVNPPVTPDPAACGAGATRCGSVCVNLASTPAHCGACGRACTPPQGGTVTCQRGRCGFVCPAGRAACNGVCVAPASDPANCGSCGISCRAGEVCSAGTCVRTCGGTMCGNACVNTSSDPANCNGCGKVCPGASGGVPVCAAGKCGFECTAPLVRCGNACVNVASDPRHCGGCNAKCAGGDTCTAGQCTPPCGAGQTQCRGACVNTQSNPAHCGRCDNACLLTCLLGICL